MMELDRRSFLGAGAAAALLPPLAALAQAQAPSAGGAPFFADTPLARNRLAAHFKPLDMALPDIPVTTAQGKASLAGIGGKTRILSLWAEWCVPCLVEIRDFAKMRPRYANDRFDIGLLLTASQLDRAAGLARLRPLGAEALPLVAENGARAAEALAVLPGAVPRPGKKTAGFSLPCTLLVDARGRVRARAFGAPAVSTTPLPALTEEEKAALKRGERVVRASKPLTDADKKRMLATGATIWSTAAGEEFLAALSGGLLDRM